MKKLMFLSVGVLLLTSSSNATEVIDKRRVYNPQLNECVSVFNVKTRQNDQTGCELNLNAMLEVEQVFLSWISGGEAPEYMREFDTSRFHYQFVENKVLGKCKTAVIMMIPDSGVRADFYSELASGLEIPGTRCITAHCTWINDGEIFSFIVDREQKSVSGFRNWRFEQEDFHKNPIMSYYSQLIINYKCSKSAFSNTTLVHFVNDERRSEIPVKENYPILIPKGKISALVFYAENRVKGIICFDMSEISKACPMNFESTVYLKSKLGYERILYARPKCEGIYEFALMEKEKFEELTSIKWEKIAGFNDDVVQN